MNAGLRTIVYVISAILVLMSCVCVIFGVLFVMASGNPAGSPSNFGQGIALGVVGLVLLAIGLGAGIYVYLRTKKEQQAAQNVTLKVDLPANVNVDQMKCKSCGGALTMDNIQMVAGAPVVSCPYCKTTYQLTEDPKW